MSLPPAPYRAFLLAAASVMMLATTAPAADWPQWGGSNSKNMVSQETGLPDSFIPGE